MAKFFIDCPHCGTANEASTFIFAKKVIKCGHCKQEIDVKANRITSRVCPHCKTLFLFDQKKDKNQCPVCKKSVSARFGKLVSFPCPECGCVLEMSANTAKAHCPVCDHEIADVAKEVAKTKLVTDTGVSVIKYEGENDVFIWKHPIEDFNFGSQLIVHESQEAIFFCNGQALDTFGPGRHTLETESLPILRKLQELPTDGKQTPFHSEVYFINKTVQMDLLWGVGDINFKEPSLDALMKIGVSGSMNMQVADSRKLLIKLVGTTDSIAWQSKESASKSIRVVFNPLLKSVVKATLPVLIKKNAIDILELDEQVEFLAEELRRKIEEGLLEYGLSIPQLHINNFALPEDDPNFRLLKKFAGEKIMKRSYDYEGTEIEAKADLEAKRQEEKIRLTRGELEFDRIAAERAKIEAEAKAERERIEAQAAADARLIKGGAGIELKRQFDAAEAEKIEAQGVATGRAMSSQGYTKKDEFAKDTQGAWAESIGQIGSQGGGVVGGGVGGGMVSEVVSMGAALATMGTVTEKMQQAMKGMTDPGSAAGEAPAAAAAPTGWVCACGQKGNVGKFCSECGKPKPEAWDCACGKKGNVGKFCSECGAAKPEAWDCACGKKGNTGKFCSECGAARAAAPSGWDCACGQKNVLGKFCPECGAKKGD